MIPNSVLKKFHDLGAVSLSRAVSNPTYRGGSVESPIVYFWDDQGREIGYWADFSESATHVFAPNYRSWGQIEKDEQRHIPMSLYKF